jgi:hypothetical protein
MTILEDGTGTGAAVEVSSDNKLSTRTISSTENQDAVVDDRAWNINTGWISTINANSALLYFKNEEADDADVFIDAIAVGFKNGSATDVLSIYFVSNPTGGTLVDATTDCDMIQNRKVGSGVSLSANTLVYKATAAGQTLTGGADSALFAQNDQGRLYATVDFLVPKGKACGIRLETDGAFSGDVYAALIMHKRKVL